MPGKTNGKVDREMLSISTAAKFANVTVATVKSALKNAKFASIFEGNTEKYTDPYGQFPDRVLITKEAVANWLEARKTTPDTRGKRTHSKGRKYFAFVTDDKIEAVNAALAPFGVNLEVAFAGKKANTQVPASNNTPVSSDTPPSVEVELVEA